MEHDWLVLCHTLYLILRQVSHILLVRNNITTAHSHLGIENRKPAERLSSSWDWRLGSSYNLVSSWPDSAREYWEHHLSHLTSHITHITSHKKLLTSHISHFTSHLSHKTFHITHHTSHKKHHTFYITLITSHLSHHTNHISHHRIEQYILIMFVICKYWKSVGWSFSTSAVTDSDSYVQQYGVSSYKYWLYFFNISCREDTRHPSPTVQLCQSSQSKLYPESEHQSIEA